MLFDYTDLDFTHNSVQIPTSPLLLFYPTHSFLNFSSVMRHSLLKSSQLAPHDFPLACLLPIALLFPNPNTAANHGVQRTASLRTGVINDSNTEVVENK